MNTLASEISDKISRKPRPSRNKDAQRHLKYLSIKHHSQEFNLQKIKIANSAARNVLKHRFSHKIQRIELQPHVFPYYAPSLRGKITELAFMGYGDYGYWRASNRKKAIVYPSFGSFKHLKKLFLPDPFLGGYVQMAKRIRGLEELQITLSMSQILKHFSLFRDLQSLKNVNLRISHEYFYHIDDDEKKMMKINQTCRLLKDLTSLKNLKALELNAEDCPEFNKQKLQMLFLELLAKSSIEKYDLAFTLHFSENLEWKAEISKVLSEIDSLRLASNRLGFSSKRQIKISKSMSFVIPTSCNISNLVSKFSNIQALTIDKVDAKRLIYHSIQPNPNLQVLDFRVSFKHKRRTLNLLAWIADYIAGSKLKFIQIQLVHLHKDLFEQFVKIHNALCPLKTETYKLANPDFESRHVCAQFIPLKNDMLRFVTDRIAQLVSLKTLSLELCLEGPGSVRYIEGLFDCLPNLTQLDLILYHRTAGKPISDPFLVTMPIYQSKKLQHARLDFSKAFKFKDLIEFFKGVSQLEELKVLNVRCADAENMTKDVRNQILIFLKNAQVTMLHN